MSPPLPAYILAGGWSKRYGSDKARADRGGRPMIQVVAEQAKHVAWPITVVSEENGKYGDLGLDTIADDQPHLGPLGGLIAALRHCDQDRLLLLACDQPSLDDWLPTLAAEAARADIVAFKADEPALAHPMPAIYATALLPYAESLLGGGRPAGPQQLVSDLHAAGRCRLLDPPGDLLDVNRPA